ncbi:MAG: hypothetical protein QOJ94_1729 [Sphingomonadales bacterium]|nr:hypothetical protein [Sphingomonadales bacterium]
MADDGNVPSLDDAAPVLASPPDPASGGSDGGGGGSPAAVQDYSLDTTRKRIAFFLLYIMAGIVVLVAVVSLFYSLGCWVNGTKCTRAEGALTLLSSGITPMFTAMIGLVGSVVGFYFGSKSTT